MTTRDVIIRHSCGAIATIFTPNREIQLAQCTAYLARDRIARVTHDLVEGQGWEAEITSADPMIVIAGGPLHDPVAALAEDVVARAEVYVALSFARETRTTAQLRADHVRDTTPQSESRLALKDAVDALREARCK